MIMVIVLEAYAVVLVLCLHATLLSCDASCVLPLARAYPFIPVALHRASVDIMAVIGIDGARAMILGQLLVVGDVVFLTLLAFRVLGSLINAKLLLFVLAALYAWSLTLK